MKKYIPTLVGLAALAFANTSRAAVFAAEVIEYQPGSGASLTDPSAALGRPDPIVGEGSGFDHPLDPFNPHYEADQVVQIGEGGHLVLRLSNYVEINAGIAQIGIFGNAGLIDADFPNGVTADPVGTFGVDPVTVSFSLDGNTWFGSTNVDLEQPTSFYTDLAASAPADFGQNHALSLTDYAGKTLAEIQSLLGGSAGGNWIDIGTTAIPRAAFLRLEVPDDGDANTFITAEIDAIAIENRAVGAPIPEPSAPLLTLAVILFASIRRRR